MNSMQLLVVLPQVFLSADEPGKVKVEVSWFYRQSEIGKSAKHGQRLHPSEVIAMAIQVRHQLLRRTSLTLLHTALQVFLSRHGDVIDASSIIFPCKVHFVPQTTVAKLDGLPLCQQVSIG